MFSQIRRKLVLLLLCSAMIIGTQQAQAALIKVNPLVDPVPLSDIVNNVGNAFPGGTLTVGDKIFSNFTLFGTSSGGAIAPTLSNFYVQGVQDTSTGEYGLMFNPLMGASSGQIVNASLAFKIAIAPNFANVIDGATLALTGASASGNGSVQIAETIFPTASPLNPLASLSGFKDANSPLSDLQQSATWSPGVKEVYVRKDIFVTGGQVGGAHLTEFFQFYHQSVDPLVPEPSTVGFGVIAVGFVVSQYVRRRKTTIES